VNVVGTHRYVLSSLVDLEKVRADLTFGLPDGGGSVSLFSESGSILRVPRNYEVPWLCSLIPESRSLVPVYPIPLYSGKDTLFLSSLRDSQKGEVVESFSREGVISLPCGRGKTVLTLASIIANKEFPALIVVHTEVLLNQWRDEILKHTNLESEDIGLLRGGVLDVQNKPITLAMLNSVSLKTYPAWVYRYFQRIVFDEVHKCGAEKLGLSVPLFYGKRLGLSATWERRDGMHRLYMSHIGPVLYEDRENDLHAEVYFQETGISYKEPKAPAKIKKSILVNRLAKNKDRNRLIVEQVTRAAESGRTVLVIGERREHLTSLASMTKHPSVGLLLGLKETSKAKKAAAQVENDRVRREAKVIYAISSMADTGFSRADLSAVFVLFPFSDPGKFIQTIGRELRHSPGKKSPVMVVFVDNIVSTTHDVSAWSTWVSGMAEMARNNGHNVRRVRHDKGGRKYRGRKNNSHSHPEGFAEDQG
jgi:superfamily II DNA or RNA helicase